MSGLADLFASIKEPEKPAAKVSRPVPDAQPVLRAPIAVEGLAKSKDPAFKQVKAYVRTETHRAAWRKYQDGGGEEFSELMQELLEQYLKA